MRNLATNHLFTSLRAARWTALLSTLAVILTMLLAVSCSKQGAAAKPADVDYYTCTMHPSVKLQDPKAKCPICGMNLVPVKKKN